MRDKYVPSALAVDLYNGLRGEERGAEGEYAVARVLATRVNQRNTTEVEWELWRHFDAVSRVARGVV